MLAIAVSRVQDLPEGDLGDVALSAGDQQRLDTFVSTRRRRQFLAVRVLARQLCLREFGPVAAAWLISTRADGSPGIVGAPQGCEVSLTHSADWVGCAVADRAVGIDLECSHRNGRPRDLDGLAAISFSSAVQQFLLALPDADRPVAFLERWTLAEAWCKQGRLGLDPARTRALRFDAADPGHAWTWSRMDQGWPVVLAVCCAGHPANTKPTPGPDWHAQGVWQVQPTP
jgi:4'-phosphopantetheinyl transferase